MRKSDIVDAIAQARGAARFLEIGTPDTGFAFGMIEAGRFSACHRLMYRCPEGFDDGRPITYRTTADGSQDLVRTLLAVLPEDARYDLIFIDPWHTYAATSADLYGALCLLAPGGVIVVHDCKPEDGAIATRDWRADEWAGVTYQAFVDFVLATGPAAWFTVDSDFGCGVVVGPGGRAFAGLPHGRPPAGMVLDWVVACADDAARFAVFTRHRQALLNLVPVAQFRAALGLPGTAAAEGPPPGLEEAAGPIGRSGWVDGIVTASDGTRLLKGWAWDSEAGAGFLRVVLLVDGVATEAAAVSMPRPDAASYTGAATDRLGFLLPLPDQAGAPDPERMAVRAWSATRQGVLGWRIG